MIATRDKRQFSDALMVSVSHGEWFEKTTCAYPSSMAKPAARDIDWRSMNEVRARARALIV